MRVAELLGGRGQKGGQLVIRCHRDRSQTRTRREDIFLQIQPYFPPLPPGLKFPSSLYLFPPPPPPPTPRLPSYSHLGEVTVGSMSLGLTEPTGQLV